MHFAKQMVACGEYRGLCGKKNERVLDNNESCSVSLSCLFQTCQDLKGNFRVFCHFFHHTRIEMLLIRFSGVSNADNFIRCSSLLCLLNSGFLPLFLPSFNSFRVVIFYGWQMKVVLASSNSRHRRTGISFRSLFMYILGTISEGFRRVASHRYR